MTSRRVLTVLFVALVSTTAACSSISTNDAAATHASAALNLLIPPPIPKPPVPTPACVTDDNTARSYAPLGPLPAPGAMPAGSYMAAIQKRGYLIAGVDQNTLGFGYHAPNGNIEGFDVDLAREIAAAIFGSRDPARIHFLSVTSAQRVPAITTRKVDLVASNMSITCDRWKLIDFSTEYYAARQSVLVRSESPINHIADLNGKRVCATKTSTSIDQIRNFAPGAKLDPVDLRPECLVHLQEGLADAISTDDTILYGLEAQDGGHARLLTDDLKQPERYGIGINKSHQDFVRFVNAVLDQIRTDGRWQLFDRELNSRVGVPLETPPVPAYRSGP